MDLSSDGRRLGDRVNLQQPHSPPPVGSLQVVVVIDISRGDRVNLSKKYDHPYLLHHAAGLRLKAEGLVAARSLVGNYTTSLEMAGASLTMTLLDDELASLWDARVHTAALRW
jgi:hypothetical protein